MGNEAPRVPRVVIGSAVVALCCYLIHIGLLWPPFSLVLVKVATMLSLKKVKKAKAERSGQPDRVTHLQME